MLFGHIPSIAKVVAKLPPNLHGHWHMWYLRKDHKLPKLWYMDVWPVGPSILVVQDNALALEVGHMRKHKIMKAFLDPIAGPENMVTLEGAAWKRWRQIFNPGFAQSHLTSILPSILDDMEVFAQIIGEHADRGKVFRLEEAATRLTFDVIAKVAMDSHLDTQRGEHELLEAFRRQLDLGPDVTGMKPLKNLNPLLPFWRWRNARRMDAIIGRALDERVARRSPSSSSAKPSSARKKTIIDLALDAYFAETGASTMDAAFRAAATSQIKIFFFAGHDTTSSLIAYAVHLLSSSPDALRRIRAEHDAVLGPDPSPAAAAAAIRASPSLLGKLEFTSAALRETLRLYPPATTSRRGEPGLVFTDPDTGAACPTDGFLVLPHTLWMHRAEEYWGPTAQRFLPQRFLPPADPERPEFPVVPRAWRAFEHGPRNCIGQELALMEGRAALALTARAFDFAGTLDPADMGTLEGDGTTWGPESHGPGVRHEDDGGQEMYQILITTAKPRQGLPVRVKRSGYGEGRGKGGK